MEMQDFLTQVLNSIAQFGGLAWLGKIALILTILVSSMKVSALNALIWSKLGPFQMYLAPVLAIVGGILSLSLGGGSITLPAVFAYLSAGMGAVALHELLDTVKAIPGIGPMWVMVISVIESALGGASKPQ